MGRRKRRKGGTLKDGERRQLARASRHGPAPLPEALVRRNIRADIERVAKAGTYPVVFEDLEVFASHAPFELHVTPQAIAGGFYRRLNGLQGHNHTYYSGAAFHSHNSTRIWNAAEVLLKSIAA